MSPRKTATPIGGEPAHRHLLRFGARGRSTGRLLHASGQTALARERPRLRPVQLGLAGAGEARILHRNGALSRSDGRFARRRRRNVAANEGNAPVPPYGPGRAQSAAERRDGTSSPWPGASSRISRPARRMSEIASDVSRIERKARSRLRIAVRTQNGPPSIHRNGERRRL